MSPAFPDHQIDRVDGHNRASIGHLKKKTLKFCKFNPQSKETIRVFEQWRGVPEQPPQCRPPKQQPHLERWHAEREDEGREDKGAATENRSRSQEERKSNEGGSPGDGEAAATVDEMEAYLPIHLDAAPALSRHRGRRARVRRGRGEESCGGGGPPRRWRHRKLSNSSNIALLTSAPTAPWNASTTSLHSHLYRGWVPRWQQPLHRPSTVPAAFPQAVPPPPAQPGRSTTTAGRRTTHRQAASLPPVGLPAEPSRQAPHRDSERPGR
jgi:hypothetical protein